MGTYRIRPKGYAHSLTVRGGTSDPLLVYSVFTLREYPVLCDPAIDLVIDAGANVGYSVAYFAQNYPGAKIVAIEPEPDNYVVLCKNIAKTTGVVSHNRALWYRHANVRLANPGSQTMCFRFVECAEGGLPSMTLSDIIQDHRGPGKILLKLDIEGAEAAIFERDASWLANVDYVFIEIHACWQQVFRALYPYNYSARINGENVIITMDRG